MKIRYRLMLAIVAVVSCAAVIVYTVTSPPIKASFAALERNRAQDDVIRIHRALEQVLAGIHAKSVDWANWDDTYTYLQNKNQAFLDSNLAPEALGDLKLDLVMFLEPSGKIVHQSDNAAKPSTGAYIAKELNDRGLLKSGHAEGDGLSGILLYKGQPIALSLRPVVRSNGDGPSRGWVVFAKYLDSSTLSSLREITRNLVSFASPDSADSRSIVTQLQSKGTYIADAGQDSISGYSLFNDLSGKPALLLQTSFSKKVSALGARTISSVNFQLLLMAFALGSILILVVERIAISRTIALRNQVSKINDLADGAQVTITGKDEIGALAAHINEMLLKLQDNAKILLLREEQLKAYNESLEQTVQERTQEIEHQAFHDKLTGLPNRALFKNRLDLARGRAKRNKLGTAVLFVDLDNFKLVNDSLGHGMGDRLLVDISQILSGNVRPGDTTARLGGDEFTILLEDLSDIDEAVNAAERILQALRRPIKLGNHETYACASIGIAFCNDPKVDGEAILRNADTAMYRAKASGKSTYVVYDATMNDHAIERLELETSLRSAIAHGELSVHYQPLIDLETNQMLGAEALARWHHPLRGNVPPSEFIPIAEDTGLIISIGYWVLEQACAKTVEWSKQPGSRPLMISVNLSGKQLQRDDVVERVKEVLEKTGLNPKQLKLEITESVLMNDREDVIDKMSRLKALGLHLALDDFGTGYSSLSTLRAFPIDTLKIDRSFISRLGEEDGAMAIVEAILALAKTMRMDVTGEGVETDSQHNIIRELGCNTGQGYLFDKPLTAEAFEARLAEYALEHAA